MELLPCGTHAAYQRHLRAGEKACKECRAANAKRSTKYLRTSPEARASNAKSSAAWHRAASRLKARHPAEYRALYDEEKDR